MAPSEHEQSNITNITPRTWLPLGLVASIIVAIAIATWRISEQLHDMQVAVSKAGADRWTLTDQVDFANQLAVQNRAINRNDAAAGILVPDPRAIRVRTLESQRQE